MTRPSIYWEDFREGDERTLGPVTVTAEEIIDFARQWDPQPMHLDQGAEAIGGFYDGLIASGWHSCCILMRMICDEFLLDAASMGAPGIQEVRWLKPVRPGDRLSARCKVLQTRASKSRPAMGVVGFRYEMTNQAGELVLTQSFSAFFGRRSAEAAQ